MLADFFKICPDAKTASMTEEEKIEEIIMSLGLYKKRAKTIQRFSKEYLEEDWTYVTELYGVGK